MQAKAVTRLVAAALAAVTLGMPQIAAASDEAPIDSKPLPDPVTSPVTVPDPPPIPEGLPHDTDSTLEERPDTVVGPTEEQLARISFRLGHPVGRPRTDTGYLSCQMNYWMSDLGVRYNASNTHYWSFHVVYTDNSTRTWAASLPGSADVADGVYRELHECLRQHRLVHPVVLSWDSIWQQIRCHAFYHWTGLGGSTWDLEGFRPDNPSGHLSPLHGCNW